MAHSFNLQTNMKAEKASMPPATPPLEYEAAASDKQWEKEWEKVRHLLRKSVGPSKFEHWLAPLAFGACEDGRIVLHAPTKFLANWIGDHYGSKLRQCWSNISAEIGVHIIRVDIVYREDMKLAPAPAAPRASPHAPQTHAAQMAAEVETPLDPRLCFDNFVVAESNHLAYQTARDLVDDMNGGNAPAHQGPLFIHGDIGQGKTHLLHAIGLKLRHSTSCRVINLSAERFRYYFIRALQQDDMMAFKNRFCDADILIMDDLQFLSGKATLSEFFHLLNVIHDNRGRLIVAATKLPVQFEQFDERIRSRLGGGLVVNIQPANAKLRQDIIRAKLRALQPPVAIAPQIVNYLARNITTNIRELEGALNRIIAHARHAVRQIDVEQARFILRDLIQAEHKRITISDIQRKTAEYFDISVNDLLSARRQRAIARPRQIAMFLAKQLTPKSLPDIGRRFGGRDHTTVLHALRRIEELCASNPRVERDVAALRQICQQTQSSPRKALLDD